MKNKIIFSLIFATLIFNISVHRALAEDEITVPGLINLFISLGIISPDAAAAAQAAAGVSNSSNSNMTTTTTTTTSTMASGGMSANYIPPVAAEATLNWSNPNTNLAINSFSSKTSYALGEAPYFNSLTAGTKNGGTLSITNGYNVQGFIFKSGSQSADQSDNALWSFSSGAWSQTFKPINTAGTYRMEIVFYCSHPNSGCGQTLPGNDQVVKSFNFTVGNTPTVTTTVSAGPQFSSSYIVAPPASMSAGSKTTLNEKTMILYDTAQIQRLINALR